MRMNVLEREEIKRTIGKALRAKPVVLHMSKTMSPTTCFEIEGEIYSPDAAVEKILEGCSWSRDEPTPVTAWAP